MLRLRPAVAVLMLCVLGSAAGGCHRKTELQAADVLAGYSADAVYRGLTIDNPLDQTLFPPEMAPPEFRWRDANARSDAWLIAFEFPDGGERRAYLTQQAEWRPAPSEWEEIKHRCVEKPATVIVLGVNRSSPETILSGVRISIGTSKDAVGAPLFYREVNLPFAEAVKDPTKIRWRFGPISQTPPVVLEHLPVCGNCHSFSADGRMLGMDVDYANDKGSYAFTAVRKDVLLPSSEIITWSDFRRDDGEATFGLLSQVSPDGRYAISTVKDRSVFVAKTETAFSQLFFPIRGILAVYDRQSRTYRALPGADDPQYVQSNPSWSPDGKYVVFARSAAYRLRKESTNVLLTPEQCEEFLEEGKTFLFDLYRIPFNGGEGGTPEPLTGASNNGMSNFFAKYSPDGKWIVFCKARSYMLLQPDSELYIVPAEGGEARRLACNTGRMNSWHSWSPNGKWLVFSSKAASDHTQLYLTHIDDAGNSTPAVSLSHLTSPDRAANIPEFVNAAPDAIARIQSDFVDDVSYVRAGDAFLRANDVAGAVRQLRKAVEINPNNSVAQSNLGGVLVTQGAVDEGVAHLKEAMRLDPTNGSPHYNLGMLRSRQGRVDEAIEQLTLAVRLRPDVAEAHRVLGALLCSKGAAEEGMQHLAEAVRLAPTDAAAQYALGKALAEGGKVEEAIEHLNSAVQSDPKHVEALRLAAQLLDLIGKEAEAIGYLSRVVELSPDDARALADLAWILALSSDPSRRDGARAAELARRACELTRYREIAPLDILGMSCAAAGLFPEAIKAAEQALQLAREAGNAQAVAGIQQRLDLYRSGRPYELPARPPR